MKLYEYSIRRLFLLIFVLLGVTIFTFYLSRIVLNPLGAYVTERTRPEAIPIIEKRLGLDKPFFVQYAIYLEDLITLNWGWSRVAHMPVIEALWYRFPATAELAIAAFLITIALGVPLGILSALKNNKAVDHIIRIIALTGISIPVFWLALTLQYSLSYLPKVSGLPSLPSSGRFDPVLVQSYPFTRYTGFLIFDCLIQGNLVMAADTLTHLILPSITLAFLSVGQITRVARSSMLEVMRQDYISTARAYGLSERVVIYKYALKNALIPITTVSGLMFGGLLGGALITETIFAFPGMGQLTVFAISSNDSYTILAFTVLASFIYVIINLVVDLLYAKLDPRIRY
ncbi:MAG: ABC transporter permease [Nitrososphaeria archaeon]